MDKETLQRLRKLTGPSRLTESGIYLIYRSRYEDSAREVERLVRTLGGVAYVSKKGKTVCQRGVANKTWRVEFTVSIDVDNYLTGRVGLKEVA